MSEDTEITQSISSENPANNDSLEGLNEFLQNKIYLHLEKVIPGIVTEYNINTNRASVKPLISGVATQGAKVSKDVLPNIPVLQLGGGDVTMTFPIKVGMTGWLIACDRDISIYKSIKAETTPNTHRKHKYQDSFFIPDAMNNKGTNYFQIESSGASFSLDNTKIIQNTTSTITLSTSGFILSADSANLNVPTIQCTGTLTAVNLNATAAATGTFKTGDNPQKTVTVVNGIITQIV